MQSALRNLIIATLVFLMYVPVVTADYNTVSGVLRSRLEALDSLLLSLSKSDALSSRRIKDADTPFKNASKKFPEFQTLMRTNSKGKVVNEVVNKGRPGRKFRDVSSQGWFGETAGMNPYYGFLKMRDGITYLFWCKPIPVSTREGGYRFGGALVAKIELSEIFQYIAKETGEPFQLVQENDVIFKNKWSGIDNPASEKVSIKGLDNVVLKGERAAAPQNAGADSQAVAQTASANPAKQEETPPAAESEKAGGAPWLMIIVLILASVGGVFVVITLRKSSKKRHAELLAEIEGDKDEADFSEESKRNPGFDEGATVIMPAPRKEIEQQKAMGRVSRQADSFSQAYNSHGEEPTQAIPQIGSQEMYSRIRQEVFQEMKGKMDAQFKKQLHDAIAAKSEQLKQQIYAQTQQSVARNMQAYSSVLAQQIHTLSGVASQSIPEQNRMQALSSVLNELKRMHGSMSGNAQPNSNARAR